MVGKVRNPPMEVLGARPVPGRPKLRLLAAWRFLGPEGMVKPGAGRGI